MFEGSDHYVVSVKIKVKGRWEYGRKNGKGMVSKVLARRAGFEQAWRHCLDRERWRLFCRDHSLRGCSQEKRGIKD